MKVNIPESQLDGFKIFAALDDSKKTELISQLLSYPIGYSPDILLSDLSSKFSIIQNEISNMLISFSGMISAIEYSNDKLEDFVDGVLSSLKDKKIEGLTPTLRGNLVDLLNSENNFYITTKALNLTFENENILRSVSVLTDIRPVFTTDNDNCKLTGSVIVHTLRISYLQGRSSKVIDFSLDNDDINRLKEQLLRTEVKERTIRETMKPEPILFKKSE